MSDLLGTLKALLDFLNGFGPAARKALLQPLVTVLLLLALYAGWHVQDEGSLSNGLRVAFLDSQASRAQHDRDLQAALLRAELYQAAQSDKLINQLLNALLQEANRAARVRLGVIHNGISGITGIGLLRYDVTNAVAAPGHTAGESTQNRPLSEWSELLPKLLAGKCDMQNVAELPNLISRVRLQSMGAASVLACPVTDIHGALLGAVFVVWDTGDTPPREQALAELTDCATRIGAQLAAALDLRSPSHDLKAMIERSPGAKPKPKSCPDPEGCVVP